MSIEQALYESGWRYCARCGTRRPAHALTNGECTERGWCDKALPSCDGCGLPVEQPKAQGRPRKRHDGCRALAAKMKPENAQAGQPEAFPGISEAKGGGR